MVLAAMCAMPDRALAFWDPVTAQCEGAPLEGTAVAIDGDSLEMTADDGARLVIHLFTLSAPELFQDCRDADGFWSCGRDAKRNLDGLLEGRKLSCTPCRRDPHGGIEALCRDGDRDINAEVLRGGFATTHAYFSNAMHSAEVQARRQRRGLWRGDWVHPDAWRQGVRLGTQSCQGCFLPQ
jgi:endonuclease YncB( thermonuclease family)